MNIQNNNFASIDEMRRRISDTGNSNPKTQSKEVDSDKSFDQMLRSTADQVHFSKHAARRLETRNIDISEEQKARLQDATEQAVEKGMTESLVMVDNLAFIVNVKDKTVVTAVNDTSKAVFTNIDGAIIN